MSNEELAIKIQSGHTEYIPKLWEQIAAFVEWRAKKYLAEYPPHYQDLKDDLVNEGYFAMLRAAEDYDDNKGAFLTYLSYHLRTCFRSVIFSGRGKRHEADPLNRAISLDVPIEDADDLTLADMIIDDEAEAYYRHIEDIDFWESVNRFLYEAIDHIKDEKGRAIVRYMYENGGTKKEAAEKLYPGQGRLDGCIRNAIAELWRYMGRSAVKREMQLIGLDDYVYGWGVGAWKNHLFTSSVEWAAIRHVDAERESQDVKDIFYRKPNC